MRRLSDDSGAIAVLFAIVLVVVIGISALAVDVGYWYTSKQQLQSAADAAALAGCRELADKATNSEIWAVVEDYAARNFSRPLTGVPCSVVPPSPGGMSDITDEYVKVTVESQSPSFLSRVITGGGPTTIRAQSVARIGYLAGAGSPTPWGLSILRATQMKATMGGVTIDLWDNSGVWTGAWGSGAAGAITVSATNESAYTQSFENVVKVGTIPSGGIIRSVRVPRTTFVSGAGIDCRIEVSLDATLSATDKITATLGRSSRDLALSADGDYVGYLPVPTTADPFISAPISVRVTAGGTTQEVSAAVFVRRANFLLQDVSVEPLFAGPGDAVSISVRPMRFEYGESYQLKVEGGAGSSGNFQALDFMSLDHSACGVDGVYQTGYSGGSSYQDWIVGSSVFIHLDDLVTSLPGDKVGPTQSGIRERLAGQPLVTFAQWELTKDPDCKQVFIVPICEQIQDALGRTVFRVVSFGTFFLEVPPSGSQDPVIGRFIEEPGPGLVVVDEAPYGIVIEAVHLDSRALDF
jgi:Flp pilus assembly protein TadG